MQGGRSLVDLDFELTTYMPLPCSLFLGGQNCNIALENGWLGACDMPRYWWAINWEWIMCFCRVAQERWSIRFRSDLTQLNYLTIIFFLFFSFFNFPLIFFSEWKYSVNHINNLKYQPHDKNLILLSPTNAVSQISHLILTLYPRRRLLKKKKTTTNWLPV